jgi:outer membrane PBP1 activator LpoA protein
MTAKEYLGQAYRIDQRINSKLEQLQSLRYLATKASAVLTTDPISSTRNVHGMEDVIIKIADLKSEISADLCQLVDTKHEIVTVIKCVENNELQTLLELRYLCFKNWEQIAVEMHLDLRWIHRLHNRALNEIDKIRHY